MILLVIVVVIVSTAVEIWLRQQTDKRSNDRSNRLKQKQEDLLATLKEKK